MPSRFTFGLGPLKLGPRNGQAQIEAHRGEQIQWLLCDLKQRLWPVWLEEVSYRRTQTEDPAHL